MRPPAHLRYLKLGRAEPLELSFWSFIWNSSDFSRRSAQISLPERRRRSHSICANLRAMLSFSPPSDSRGARTSRRPLYIGGSDGGLKVGAKREISRWPAEHAAEVAGQYRRLPLKSPLNFRPIADKSFTVSALEMVGTVRRARMAIRLIKPS